MNSFEGERASEKLWGIFTIMRHWHSKGRGRGWTEQRRNILTLCPGHQGEGADMLKDTEVSSRFTEYFKLSSKILMVNETERSRYKIV